jgi:hypothetical protein
MSIPRTAIERPVTMFMLSGVIVLLGTISLLKLPVDLMPELQSPSISVRVNYPGVGPRETRNRSRGRWSRRSRPWRASSRSTPRRRKAAATSG